MSDAENRLKNCIQCLSTQALLPATPLNQRLLAIKVHCKLLFRSSITSHEPLPGQVQSCGA